VFCMVLLVIFWDSATPPARRCAGVRRQWRRGIDRMFQAAVDRERFQASSRQ
jgi:hypothetical protein